jgi:uncharacterized protein (DUF1501 family)
VVPFNEARYHDLRPTVRVPEGVVLDLDGRFGLHPVMPGLHGLYQAGRLAVVVATGNPVGNRSHFTAQDLSEWGTEAPPADAAGWLGRYLQQTATGSDPVVRAVTVGGNVTASLRPYPALGIVSVATFGLGGYTGAAAGLHDLLADVYAGPRPIEVGGTKAIGATDLVGSLSGSNAPDPTVRAFADLAVLFDAGIGLEVASVNLGGWDLHNGMGTVDAGPMRGLLAGLDAALTGFQADLDARGLSDVTTVVMTEFGRRIEENGTGGTDHGFASVMLVLGGGAVGGVHGEWLGLEPDVIGARGDVVPTVDFRDVLGDCARTALGVTNPSTLFPGHAYSPVGVAA